MTFNSLVLASQVCGMLLAGLGIHSTLAWRRQQPARVRAGGRRR
jgi:hypothetical protein